MVANDAGVQFVQGYGNSAETFRIRGLKFDGDDMTFGGLSGVLPRQVVDAQMVDRIEIFKGANSLMNGAASSGVGGMINLEPKHAGDTRRRKWVWTTPRIPRLAPRWMRVVALAITTSLARV